MELIKTLLFTAWYFLAICQVAGAETLRAPAAERTGVAKDISDEVLWGTNVTDAEVDTVIRDIVLKDGGTLIWGKDTAPVLPGDKQLKDGRADCKSSFDDVQIILNGWQERLKSERGRFDELGNKLAIKGLYNILSKINLGALFEGYYKIADVDTGFVTDKIGFIYEGPHKYCLVHTGPKRDIIWIPNDLLTFLSFMRLPVELNEALELWEGKAKMPDLELQYAALIAYEMVERYLLEIGIEKEEARLTARHAAAVIGGPSENKNISHLDDLMSGYVKQKMPNKVKEYHIRKRRALRDKKFGVPVFSIGAAERRFEQLRACGTEDMVLRIEGEYRKLPMADAEKLILDRMKNGEYFVSAGRESNRPLGYKWKCFFVLPKLPKDIMQDELFAMLARAGENEKRKILTAYIEKMICGGRADVGEKFAELIEGTLGSREEKLPDILRMAFIEALSRIEDNPIALRRLLHGLFDIAMRFGEGENAVNSMGLEIMSEVIGFFNDICEMESIDMKSADVQSAGLPNYMCEKQQKFDKLLEEAGIRGNLKSEVKGAFWHGDFVPAANRVEFESFLRLWAGLKPQEAAALFDKMISEIGSASVRRKLGKIYDAIEVVLADYRYRENITRESVLTIRSLIDSGGGKRLKEFLKYEFEMKDEEAENVATALARTARPPSLIPEVK